jgi:sarcosine oxidase
MQYDVIVVGLGGMGSAAAYHLAKRGMKVLGLEQFRPGHTNGSSHGHSRVIRQAYFEGPAYVPMLKRAYELWNELEDASSEPILHITGGLMIGQASSNVVTGSRLSAQEHGLEHELLDSDSIRRRFPELTPGDEVGLFEGLAGVVRPEAGIRAHLEIAKVHGAELHFEEPVVGWESSASHVIVRTNQGVYTAAKLILAPGAWASRQFQMELPLRVTQQTLYWFQPRRGFDLFRPPHFPIYIWQVSQEEEFYGFPWLDLPNEPQGIKVAFFYRGQELDPDSPRTTVEDHEVERMRSALRDRIPNLAGDLVHAQRCLYTETPDHHFILDHHPNFSNVILASPCSGHGYKFCTVIGEILADLVQQKPINYEMKLFRANR